MPRGWYEITGIGTTRALAPNEGQAFDFGLVAGSDAVASGYYLGWKDGTPPADSRGAIGYLTGGGDRAVPGQHPGRGR